MNEAPRYVVSASLQTGEWNNTTILGPYRAGTIGDLKDRVDGGIYVSGSGTPEFPDDLEVHDRLWHACSLPCWQPGTHGPGFLRGDWPATGNSSAGHIPALPSKPCPIPAAAGRQAIHAVRHLRQERLITRAR
jgi:hypothetical protein